jgi:post-segregation antitoxin (ccd killing protein)
MTRRVTVSLPDDVAEYLDRHPNTSALVTEAIRARMQRQETTRRMLEAAGFRLTEEGRAWARSVLKPLTDEQKAEVRRRHELITSGRWNEI